MLNKHKIYIMQTMAQNINHKEKQIRREIKKKHKSKAQKIKYNEKQIRRQI